MHLIITAPFDSDQHMQVALPPHTSLGRFLAGHTASITACCHNGVFVEHWKTLTPQAQDTVILFVETGVSVVIALAFVAASLALNAILASIAYTPLAPPPVPSNTAGKTEDIFGIAGITNTTALGTPMFLVYGTRRVFGHMISTRVQIAPDGKTTQFGALYFMGEGPIESLTDIEINEVAMANYAGVTSDTRMGDGVNTPVIAGFETVSQVWSDGRTISATPIVYTTRSSTIERITLIFSTPFLFKQNATTGAKETAIHTIKIETAVAPAGPYTEHVSSPMVWADQADAQRFKPFYLTFAPPAAPYLVRLTLNSTTNQSSTPPVLFNVQEEASGGLLYVNSALLAVSGIASSQIQSFESMRVSALEKGRKVSVWNGATFTTQWTSNRAWILRDVLLNTRVGLGRYLAASLFDDDAALVAANYWDGIVSGITRDQCDVILNDRRAGWDWAKTILQEGQALLIPSNGKLKLVVDQAGSPNLLYSMPGNVIEGSLTHTHGTGEGFLPNTIRGEFVDASTNYRPQILEVVASDIGAEPTREELTSFVTLTDIRRVYWALRAQLLRKRLVKRHMSWQSPMTALVSEPLDLASLAYETVDMARGISGFVPAGSTTTRLLLDRLVTLAAATTYALIVRHQATNTVERKVVSTVAGTWGAIAPTVAFSTAPAEGDLWALGVQNTAILTVKIERVEPTDALTYTVMASEYQSSVHDFPAPPANLGGGPGNRRKPLPFWSVSASEWTAIGMDGGTSLNLVFDVTPGVRMVGGPVASADATHVTLGATMPNVDDYFTGTAISIVEGTGSSPVQSRAIYVYVGATRTATVTVAWTVIPDATSLFVIDQGEFSEYNGMIVESQFLGTSPNWAPFFSTTGPDTRHLDGIFGGPFTISFRFTPIGLSGLLNTQGRWIVTKTIAGDTTVPDTPTEITVEVTEPFIDSDNDDGPE